MFARRYFPARYFAPRYFPKPIGAVAVIYAGRLEYTAEESRIEWRAEPALIAFTAEESRIDWRAER